MLRRNGAGQETMESVRKRAVQLTCLMTYMPRPSTKTTLATKRNFAEKDGFLPSCRPVWATLRRHC